MQVLTCGVNLALFRVVSGGPSVKLTCRPTLGLRSASTCGCIKASHPDRKSVSALNLTLKTEDLEMIKRVAVKRAC